MLGLSQVAACSPKTCPLRLSPYPSLAWWIELIDQRKSRSAHSVLHAPEIRTDEIEVAVPVPGAQYALAAFQRAGNLVDPSQQ
jgi:hypothetical protein